MIENIRKGEDSVEEARGKLSQRRKKKWIAERERLWADVGSLNPTSRVRLGSQARSYIYAFKEVFTRDN